MGFRYFISPLIMFLSIRLSSRSLFYFPFRTKLIKITRQRLQEHSHTWRHFIHVTLSSILIPPTICWSLMLILFFLHFFAPPLSHDGAQITRIFLISQRLSKAAISYSRRADAIACVTISGSWVPLARRQLRSISHVARREYDGMDSSLAT